MNKRQKSLIREFILVCVIIIAVVLGLLNFKDYVNRTEGMRAMAQLGRIVLKYRQEHGSVPPEYYVDQIKGELEGSARLGGLVYRARWIEYGATGDEILATFALIKRTGRDAPYFDDNGQLIDPNLPAQRTRTKCVNMTARVRITAESFSRPFGLDELWNAVTDDEKEYRQVRKTIRRLRAEGELVESQDGWRLLTDITPKRIREKIKNKFIGKNFMLDQLEITTGPINSSIIRRVITELKVDGFKVSILRSLRHGRKVRAYLVEAS